MHFIFKRLFFLKIYVTMNNIMYGADTVLSVHYIKITRYSMTPDRYNTKIRKAIISFFENDASSSYNAKDVYNYLIGIGTATNITTVYRNLEKLEEEHTIIKCSSEDGKSSGYILNRHGACCKHLHLKCTVCGKIAHLDCSDTSYFISHIMSEHGFILDCGKSMLYGKCADCLKKSEKT